MTWDEDLSGPFAVLIIDKQTSSIYCVTDLMSFIPVFSYQHSTEIMISTHVDVLGVLSKQHYDIDIVSKVDFILYGIVTYPYTIYRRITQLHPASVHFIGIESENLSPEYYWLPYETFTFKTIGEAAGEVQKSLESYVTRVTEGMSAIALFISGGEDSRAVLGLLPKELKRDAFIFLNSINREGKRAKEAANAYNVNFEVVIRSNSYYLEILPLSSDLVGSGAEYIHSHTLKFHKSCRLADYSAVFGGLYSDELLKGDCIEKAKWIRRLPFLPQIKSRNHSKVNPINTSIFKKEILDELTRRRKAHLKRIGSIRAKSADEWFELWPSSMNSDLPSVHANRRLFRSYEPYMGNDIVKICASVPQKWTLNRRLFRHVARPYLEQSKWLLHSDGRLPYFPWYINSFVQFGVWSFQQISKRTGLVKGFQGPWGEWEAIMKSQEYQEYIYKYADGIKVMSGAFTEQNVLEIFKSGKLTTMQQINLLQTLYGNLKNIHINEEPLEKRNEKLI
ncbi:hypothetical protein AC739_19030 [Planococcus glaciei]|nr:hypothetical protein AC739_19030 [Planococcus glaciei]